MVKKIKRIEEKIDILFLKTWYIEFFYFFANEHFENLEKVKIYYFSQIIRNRSHRTRYNVYLIKFWF